LGVRSTENESEEFRLIEELDIQNGKTETEGLTGVRAEDGVEVLLEKMLRFLGEMPVDDNHDYRFFRHSGLRSYLINRFLLDKRSKEELY
jgi:hypothetical protein